MKAMNKKLLKWLAITACSLTCATTLGVGVSTLDNPQTATAYEITFDSADALKSAYMHGSTLTVPMGTIEGVQATSYMVVAPSGYAFNSKTVTLSEAGRYTIKWFATVGGKEVSAEKSFLVAKSAFTAEGEVTCEYKEDLEHAQFVNKELEHFTKTDITYEGDGIQVTVGANSKFTYNNVIDLRNFSNEHFIEIFPYQQLWNVWSAPSGSYCEFQDDAKNYLITLTDCYDPSNYVTIDLEFSGLWFYAHRANAYYMNYRAAAAGQVAHGLEKSVDGKLTIDGEKYNASFEPIRGASGTNVSQLGMKLYYDTETQKVYVTFADFICSKNDGVWNERALLADLANEKIYPDNAFKGFTTGEVYLSLSAKNIVDRYANMDITSIGGVSGRAMLEMVQDTEKPEIRVNEGLETMKTIALNEAISIPDALCIDPNGLKLISDVAVYYDYDANSANNALVGIVNGKFTPKKTGKYTIVYTAEDTSENSSVKTVELECVEVTNGKAVTLTVSPVEVEAGAYVDVPVCEVNGLYSDESLMKVYYVDKNGEQKLYTDSQIFLDRLGEFKFAYVYETPFNTYTTTAIINALATDKVVMDAPALPQYFIKGAKYTLDTVLAYQYTEGASEAVPSQMYMKADDGEYVEVDPKEVTINANSTVQFKYTYLAGLVETDPIKVLDVGFGGALSTKDYFYTEDTNVTKNATKDYLQFITNASAKTTTLTYINPLAIATFDVEFNFISKNKAGATYVAPTSITFSFTDYYDNSKVATFKIRPAKAGLYVDVNGVQRVGQLPGRTFLDIANYLSYQDGVMKFEGLSYDLGNVVTSDRVLFEITIETATKGESCMNLTLLCDNVLTSAKYDSANPKLYIAKKNMGYHKFGSVITIGKAVASDLLAPYLESGLTVTVMTPNGTFAKSEDGVTLNGSNPVDREYQVKLDEIGVYSVVYTYTDQNGGFESFAYSPIIKDEQGPTIVVEGKVKDDVVSAKWGSSVAVATYSVFDDVSEPENIKSYVNVAYPSGVIRKIPNGGSFYAEEKGQYRVMYYALDEVGNMTWFSYFVQVS